MNYQALILEKLIGKYENSKSSKGTTSTRKIAFRMQNEKKLNRNMEIAEEKEQFLAILERLKQRGLIDYSWVRYETGNLVDRIWLILEEGKIRECYQILKRVPKGDKVDTLKQYIVDSLTKIKQAEEEIRPFLEKQLEYIQQKQSIPRFFTDDRELSNSILNCLCYLAQNEQEIQERVLSSYLYNDSKYFERHVKGKVLSILRAIKKEKGEEVAEEELLPEKGVVKWPEILEFTGKVIVYVSQGTPVDFSSQQYGAYINSLTVVEVQQIDVSKVKRVLFIENKANYVWYIQQRKEEELVIYHGGCYSPVKGKWFRKLYESFEQEKEEVEFYHWGDIDLGGLKIFIRLKAEIIPHLKPYKMDIETLENNQEKGTSMKESYRKLLEEMRKDIKYKDFDNLIKRMLELDIRLEQEQLLYEVRSKM
ncbi:hypothetical protein HYG86_14725 [Alkalicella caledoniensis]|uniref:Wadjet protein JetD C-terminal domain-containing protein n=1 Tax=Alkalicella caledoniensis TaxID=2731377 RepID=A0A7G9WB70_ALKCA|nr:Wadjet anti-phage system protein JetD domain-containing protein [Alkalicella caledoniensis]QNO15932.1 hypothetical protein HYG86_14725 [Alkalicella caledoniensis]